MTADIQLQNLRCEYFVNPLGLDVARPRLSWTLQSSQRGQRQTAYQILVASSAATLAADKGDLWDSGRVTSNQSAHIVYAGAALRSRQRVWWKVRVWDRDGQSIAYSPSAWWEMGLLEPSDWCGEWIGAGLTGGPRTTSPAPYVRTQFTLDRPVAQARLYATALGLYEAYLNGQVVGADLLTPGWTDYTQRVQYQVYDVTALLQPGANRLGAILGDGWYCGSIAWGGRQIYGDRPKFLAQLVVTFDDGSTQTIATDDTWQTAFGPILESDFLAGESYDARRELTGWDTPATSATPDRRWLPVETFADPGIPRVAMRGPTVKRVQTIQPIAEPTGRGEKRGARWIFDLGQNMVGWVRLKVSGPAGTTITLRFAEVLNPDDGTLYTTSLRTARATDHYTLKGEGEEVWEPRFTFHGFRYVELAGYPGTPTRDTITGIVIHSDTPLTGAFECSDPLLNQLQHNIEWGQRGNFVDVPTDCPQRDERLGWTGDAQVFIRTAAFNMDVASFFTKWSRDLEDAQPSDGAYPSVAPNPGLSGTDGGPAWADAGIICPWTIYQCFGDTRLLEERYTSMQHYIDYLERTSRDLIRVYEGYEGFRGYGDWLAQDGSTDRFGVTPKDLIGTAFFSYSSRLLSRIATIMGRDDDARRYAGLADRVRDAFRAQYLLPDGRLSGGTQTAYVLALQFDLLPEGARAGALDALVQDIKQRGMHLSTGFVGTPYLNWVLSDNGRLDVAYALLKQTSWPSWLYSVTQGATTIWERWDGWTHDKGFQDPGMNSFNHYAYGAIGAWMYAVVGGIDTALDQPGYQHSRIWPQPGGGLTWARVAYDSIHGPIASHWQIENNTFTLTTTIPANTTATVAVPSADATGVTEGGQPATEADGVTFLRQEGDRAVFAVASGTYTFTSRLPNEVQDSIEH